MLKLKCPHLLKPVGTIIQQNYWFFYPSELIYFIFFTMRHPVHRSPNLTVENGWQIYILCGMILSKEKKFTPIINVFLPCLLCVLCNLYIFICHTYSFAISFSFTKRKNWLGKWKLICYREIRGLSLGHLLHTFKLLYDSKTKSCDRNLPFILFYIFHFKT